MVLALIAFVIGSAYGIMTSIGQHENETAAANNTTHFENVTVEMTTGLGENQSVEFDYDKDYVDYNENYTAQMSNYQ